MPLLEKIAPGLIGEGMGLLLEGHNDRRQLDMQQKLQDMQMKGQKDMALFNYQQQMKMWNETNYKAQVAQLNKAGLNPGLLYGMGGTGGATIGSAQGQGPGMGDAPKGGGEALGMGIVGAQTAAQLALLKAQKDNIEADTANKEAQTTKTAGVDTKLGETQISSLTQGINNQKAVETLTKIQGDIAEYEKEIKGETLKASIYMAKYQTDIALQQLNIIKNEGIISENTWMQKIELIEQELAGKIASNELTRTQTTKTEAETQQLSKTIALEYAKLKNLTDQTEIQKKLQEFQTSFGGQASNILGQLLQFIPGKSKAK